MIPAPPAESNKEGGKWPAICYDAPVGKLLYFAYGSNMLTARLRARCESATPVGKAYAEGYILQFSKPSADRSGKGHLALASRKSARQGGVLFEIDASQAHLLDQAEGVGAGYARHDNFPLVRADNRQVVNATVYLATAPDTTLLPYDWYLALIVAGAVEHRFDRRRIRQLLSHTSKPHTSPPWGGRNEALALLDGAGIDRDYAKFFAMRTKLAKPRPKPQKNTPVNG